LSLNFYAFVFLRVLVVDEADSLLSEHFHGWINHLFKAMGETDSAALTQPAGIPQNGGQEPLWWEREVLDGKSSGFGTALRDVGDALVRFDHMATPPGYTRGVIRPSLRRRQPLRRVLCSATLTDNPQKLYAIRLNRPVILQADQALHDAPVHILSSFRKEPALSGVPKPKALKGLAQLRKEQKLHEQPEKHTTESKSEEESKKNVEEDEKLRVKNLREIALALRPKAISAQVSTAQAASADASKK
jgi:superfamily II DNA/RNA helicase